MLLNPHRYGLQVMEKVLKMAEGIDIGEMRTYELVPSRKIKRCHSPSDSEYICLCVKGDTLPCRCFVGITGSMGRAACHGAASKSATAN